MDANQLRLILLLAGMALVAAIYLWDRYQRSRRKLQPLSLRKARKFRKEFGLDEPEPERMPSFSATEADKVIEPEPGVTLRVIRQKPVAQAEAPLRQPSLLEETSPAAEPEPEPEPEPSVTSTAEPEPPAFSALEHDDYLHAPPEVRESLPQLLIQVGVVASEGETFSGADLARVLESVGLRPGEMDIYHCPDERHPDRVLFSVANLFKPGTFPFNDLEHFETRGLLFFTQLPGVRDGQEIYDRLLEAAYRVATALGGQLQDENHSALGKQSVQHTRDRIAEHHRQLELAMKMRKAN